jgi:benzoate 4-monooxygenase
MGILYDKTIFPRPDEFDPQRWLVSATTDMMEFFQPFSYGPRSCIGRKYVA